MGFLVFFLYDGGKVVLELEEGMLPLWFKESLDWIKDGRGTRTKGQKVPLSNEGEMEPGFRDFQRALSAPPPLLLTQVESVFMITSAFLCQLISRVLPWCILMHLLQLLISIRENPSMSVQVSMCRVKQKTLSVLEISSRSLFWLYIKVEYRTQ